MSGTKIDSETSGQKTILLIDNSPINQSIITKWLQKYYSHRFQVHAVGDAQEAIHYIQQSKVCAGNEDSGKDLDVILVQWSLPVTSGIDLTRRIRVWEVEGMIVRQLPIIGMSWVMLSGTREEAIQAGADELLPHPLNISTLVDIFDRCLEKYKDA